MKIAVFNNHFLFFFRLNAVSKKPSAWDLVITLQKADYPVVIQAKEDGNFEVSLKRSSCQNYA